MHAELAGSLVKFAQLLLDQVDVMVGVRLRPDRRRAADRTAACCRGRRPPRMTRQYCMPDSASLR